MPISPTPRPRRRRAAVAVIAVAAVVVACGSTGASGSVGSPPASRSTTSAVPPASSTAPSSGPKSASPGATASFDPAGLRVTLESVATGLDAPLAIVNAHDGSHRLFVVEQGGRIRIVKDGTLQPAPFLDISSRISSGGERGLLGLAFHPGFPTDPRLFVDYTDPNGDTQVSSFTVNSASPDQADPGSEVKILHVQQPYANHNGGAVVFGPDGKLFISFGDGGSGGDPQGNGQNPRTLLGKILRIDVDSRSGDRQYAIPPDNPFADGAGGAPEIWLTGLRNPWRISFDRATGDLWIGDVGQSAWEEVDVQRAGAPGGTNYGWNRMEGRHCFQPSSGCDESGLTMPVTEYGHDQGCTVIGGSVVRGPDQPALIGGYLFADYCSGRIWAIDPSTDAYRDPTAVADSGHSIAAFGEDEAGNLYAADISGGAILRVTATRG
jgi:glucose/arabinose dehydrogenase